MKKKNKITPDELDALHGALKELRATLGFDEDDETEDDWKDQLRDAVKSAKELADDIEELEDRARMITLKMVESPLENGANCILYASAFSAFMTLSCVRAQLQNAVDFIKKQSQRDAR